jgi:iron complex transport system ATP-binding protein
MINSAIQVKNASFSYGKKLIFNSLNFYVKPGEVFCIVGPNGCGKTTLLDCILGVLKLGQGSIFFEQYDVASTKPFRLAEKVAFVPQVHQKAFPYTVKEIVLMGRAHNIKLFSSPSKEDMEIAYQSMKRIGILHLAEKPYTQISGGECQLVMIARALAQQPSIIIMDEPTSHLDFKNELIFLETVADLVNEDNISIVMATHFLNHAYYFEANGIPITMALMNNGCFQQIGSPHKVLSENSINRIYGIDSLLLSHNLDNNTIVRQIVPLSIAKDV